MARGLDHIAHAVRDLDAVAHLYRRLGFTVGARNKHSWGTHNHIVQMPGFFIELLTLAEPEKLGDDGFSKLFGRYNGAFIERGEGLSLLVLESADAAADAQAYKAANISASDVLRFDREGKRPDGSTVRVAFSLTFAADKLAPWIAYCTCQQHYPENFWNPAFQHHHNSVTGVGALTLVADDPAQHASFLSAYTGANAQKSADTVSFALPRGALHIMTPAAFRTKFGTTPPETKDGARLAALSFKVTDVASTEDAMAAGEIDAVIEADRVVVPPEIAMGATIVFEE